MKNPPELIRKLLEFNLNKFVSKIKFCPEPTPLTLEEISILLNEADRLSFTKSKENHIQATALCALIAEILPSEALAGAAFISKILIRLGLTPTAKMLQTNLNYNEKDSDFYFNDLGSYFDNLTSQIHISSNEVKIKDQTIRLTKFQKTMWDTIEKNRYVGLSAPTSAGKSFLLAAKIVDSFSKSSGTVVYIVPTVSLVNQVSRDIVAASKTYSIEGIKVLKSFSKNINITNPNNRVVYVVTQERATAFFSNSSGQIALARPLTLIVDEIQNIEQLSGDGGSERSMILLDVIHKFLAEIDPEKFIISGPRLKNLENILDTWVESENMKCETDNLPTVINICYTFKKDKTKKSNKIIVSQYVEEMPTVSILVDDEHHLKNSIIGKSKYDNPAAHNLLSHLTSSIQNDGGSLIFSKSSLQCYKTAIALADNEIDGADNLHSLIEYSKETVHSRYGLAECLEKGIAYHHGKVPHHIRIPIEAAFSNGTIKKLVCTSTLMQGVNLPAKNIIIRNPEISKKKLSSYEFANLRGRAGRLMKDFIGRAILIDEDSFSEEAIEMQSSSSKELDFTYGSKFKKHKREVLEILFDEKDKVNTESTAAELAIYVEQVLYKTSVTEAMNRLKSLGIYLTINEANKIKHLLTYLDIPRDIVISNPFWSPRDLQKLFDLHNDGAISKIPKSPFLNLKGKLVEVNGTMRRDFPYYFKKYVDIAHEPKLISLCGLAQDWARGVPLKELINSWPVTASIDVETRIGDISNTIPYKITKLIKPLVDIQYDLQNSSIITFLETGCFDIEQRTLLNLGLAREVVLRTVEPTRDPKDDEAVDIDLLLNKLSKRRNSVDLSVWDTHQINETLHL